MLNVLVFWAVSPLLEDGVGPILIDLHADLPQNKRLLATLGRTAKSINWSKESTNHQNGQQVSIRDKSINIYVWCLQKGSSQSHHEQSKIARDFVWGPSWLSHPRLGVGNPASRRFPNFPSSHLLSSSQMWKLSKWSSRPLWHTVLSDSYIVNTSQ